MRLYTAVASHQRVSRSIIAFIHRLRVFFAFSNVYLQLFLGDTDRGTPIGIGLVARVCALIGGKGLGLLQVFT